MREQAALLLSSFAVSKIGRDYFEEAFGPLKALLEDEDIKVREAAAFTIMRVSVNDDGCRKLVDNAVPEQMIQSFILHSEGKSVQYDEAQYLISLLEAFINLTFSDYGIETLLGKDAIKNFTKILDDADVKNILNDKWYKIAELSLRVLGNMSINHEGKQECIDEKVIERSHAFLVDDPERSNADALNTSLILMSCSIHLDGKNQIVDADHHGSPYIIKTMIHRLE